MTGDLNIALASDILSAGRQLLFSFFLTFFTERFWNAQLGWTTLSVNTRIAIEFSPDFSASLLWVVRQFA